MVGQLPSSLDGRCFAACVDNHVYVASHHQGQPAMFVSKDSSLSTWLPMSPPPGSSRVHALLEINGQLWLVAWPQRGKRRSANKMRLALWQLVFRTMSWKEMTAIPHLVWDCAVTVSGSEVIFVGGLDAQGWSPQVCTFDTATQRWCYGDEDKWPSLPEGLAGASAALHDDKVVVFGGVTPLGPQGIMYALDTTAIERSWSALAHLPRVLAGGSAFEERVVVAGGTELGAACFEVFGLRRNDHDWERLPTLVESCVLPALVRFDGALLCIGGMLNNQWTNGVQRLG